MSFAAASQEELARLADRAEEILAAQPRATSRFAAEQAILALKRAEFADFYGAVRPAKTPEFHRLASAVERVVLERRERGAQDERRG